MTRLVWTLPDGQHTARWAEDEGGGGGTQPIPSADPDAVQETIPTPFDDGGPATIETLVFAQDQVAASWGVEGDDFPRVCLLSDPTDGFFLGDGTVNPYTDGAFLQVVGPNKGIRLRAVDVLARFSSWISSGGNRADDVSQVAGGLMLGEPGLGAIVVYSGADAPAIGAEVGDIYFRSNPGGANQTIYRCTVAGTAGLATWVGIL